MVVPPPPKPVPKPKAAPPPIAPPVVAVMEEQPVELAATTETPLELTAPVFDQPAPKPATATVRQTEEPPFPLPLAPVWRRILARFLTLLGLALTVGLAEVILIFLPKSVTRDPLIMWSILVALPVIYLLVNAVMLARTGQDIGKRYAGIRVVNADGSKATEMTALVKRDALTFVIGLTGIGVLYWLADFVTLFGKGGRTLHDRIAGTRVVRA